MSVDVRQRGQIGPGGAADTSEQDDIRLTTNVVNVAPEAVSIGIDLEVVFEDHDPVFVAHAGRVHDLHAVHVSLIGSGPGSTLEHDDHGWAQPSPQSPSPALFP